jgi:putative flippase GtrA
MRMPTIPQALSRTAGRLPKVLRYGAASVVTTVFSLSLLAVLLLDVTAGWANLVAVGIGSIISFELNRRWVWKDISSKARWLQLTLFMALSLLFLGLSGLAVHEAGSLFDLRPHSLTRSLIIETTTVAVFGLRWATQYLFLDRLVFRAPAGAA